MADNPADRIETALARIEVAAAAKCYALDRIQQRHAMLRGRVEDTVASLDALIANIDSDSED